MNSHASWGSHAWIKLSRRLLDLTCWQHSPQTKCCSSKNLTSSNMSPHKQTEEEENASASQSYHYVPTESPLFKRSTVMTLQRCVCVWNAAGVRSMNKSSWKKGMREEQIFVFKCLFLNDFHRRAFILLWCQKVSLKAGDSSVPLAQGIRPLCCLHKYNCSSEESGLVWWFYRSALIGPSASGLTAIDSRFHAEFKASFIPDMLEFN